MFYSLPSHKPFAFWCWSGRGGRGSLTGYRSFLHSSTEIPSLISINSPYLTQMSLNRNISIEFNRKWEILLKWYIYSLHSAPLPALSSDPNRADPIWSDKREIKWKMITRWLILIQLNWIISVSYRVSMLIFKTLYDGGSGSRSAGDGRNAMASLFYSIWYRTAAAADCESMFDSNWIGIGCTSAREKVIFSELQMLPRRFLVFE